MVSILVTSVENEFNHPKENGVPPVLARKKSVRKGMSSSTPELNPTETIILDAEEELNILPTNDDKERKCVVNKLTKQNVSSTV